MKCGDCKYSRDTGTALLCWGQRFAPPVDAGDWCEGWRPKSVTTKINADLVRAMTDEELAVVCEDGCPPNHNCPPIAREEIGLRSSCQKCWLSWLKSPVEEKE